VSNAIKYTPTGKVLIGARRRGDKVIIQVMDSGIGIPASKFRTVFKEFARLDEGAKTASGLGLGLSIVDRIARVLDHPVELRSIPGRGTDFRIVMPLDLSQPIETVAPSASITGRAMQSLQGLRVLCIDNEPKILEGMQLLMSGWGCDVAVAHSQAALAEMPATTVPPDIVIADYHLGDGTGIEAINLMRQRFGSDLPALLITADRSPEVRAEAEKHGIGLQQKPVRPAALRAYLAQVSNLKRAAAE